MHLTVQPLAQHQLPLIKETQPGAVDRELKVMKHIQATYLSTEQFKSHQSAINAGKVSQAKLYLSTLPQWSKLYL